MLKKDERNFVVILMLSWYEMFQQYVRFLFFWFRSLGWVIKINSQQFCVLFIRQNDRECRNYRRKQKRVIRREDEKNMKN